MPAPMPPPRIDAPAPCRSRTGKEVLGLYLLLSTIGTMAPMMDRPWRMETEEVGRMSRVSLGRAHRQLA